jgi:hypothetical protein
MAATVSSHSKLGEAPNSRRDLYAPGAEPSFDNADTIVMRRGSVVPMAPVRSRRAPVWLALESAPSLAAASAPPKSSSGSVSGVRTAVRPSTRGSDTASLRAGRPSGASKVGIGVALAFAVAVLAAYACPHLFFLFNRTWVAPTILTPADTRVIGFASRYVEASARRDALLLQRADVEVRIREAERRLEVERAFQAASLAAKDWMTTEGEPPTALVGDRGMTAEPSTYDAVKLAADHERSVVAAQKASDEITVATSTLAALDRTLLEQDRILEAMRRSPFYGIASGRAVFAFVPYDNAHNASEGAPVYACRLGFVACRKVGSVGRAAEGEVVQKHPWVQKDVRGTLVRVELDDETAAESTILHVGRRPSPF